METGETSKRPRLSDDSFEEACKKAAIDVVNQSKQWKPNATDELTECNALDVVTFYIVFSEEDLVKAKPFKPKLAHQIFGQREKMQGYISPRIDVYFLANSAKCFFKFTHNGLCSKQNDTITTRIFHNLIAWLPADYSTDESHFIEAIKSEEHTKMFGKQISEFEVSGEDDSTSKFIIRECPIDEPGFITFHERFQCYIVWYIDAASQLDLEDSNWVFIYVYEEIISPDRKKIGYYPVGYCAAYKFFHYPDKIRTRISQCFVLPSSQNKGVGFQLLNATYKALYAIPNLVDITVEDPCPGFQRLRDRVDTSLLRELDCFKYPMIKTGFTKKMLDDANSKYKIHKRQCRRVYHILRKGYAIANGEDVDEILHKDIQLFLGVKLQTTSKLKRDADHIEHVDHLYMDIKLQAAVEAYNKAIHPVVCSIVKWVKAQKD